LVGALQSVAATVGDIFLSQGRSDLMFKMTLIISPFFWLSFLIGVHWGIVGVAVCYAAVSCCWCFIIQAVANRVISLSFTDFLKVFSKPFFYTLIMATTISATKSLIAYFVRLNLVILLVSLVSCGVVTYLVLLLRSKDHDILSLKRFMTEKGPRYIKPLLSFGI
jgi:PST family polysaccharide transporter